MAIINTNILYLDSSYIRVKSSLFLSTENLVSFTYWKMSTPENIFFVGDAESLYVVRKYGHRFLS